MRTGKTESDCGYEILKQQLSAEHLLFITGALDKELQDEHGRLLCNCTCEGGHNWKSVVQGSSAAVWKRSVKAKVVKRQSRVTSTSYCALYEHLLVVLAGFMST